MKGVRQPPVVVLRLTALEASALGFAAATSMDDPDRVRLMFADPYERMAAMRAGRKLDEAARWSGASHWVAMRAAGVGT